MAVWLFARQINYVSIKPSSSSICQGSWNETTDRCHLYLDFSKAFDRVPHEKLLFKLECLGIKGSLLAWFRSYLSGRRHRVMIDNEASDFLPVTSGVPQGSIIGPLLFLIYINDRVPGVISENTSLPLFAAAPSIKAVKFSFSIVVYTVGLVTKSVLACGDTRKKRISERTHFF